MKTDDEALVERVADIIAGVMERDNRALAIATARAALSAIRPEPASGGRGSGRCVA
jgi:hypothetical protein